MTGKLKNQTKVKAKEKKMNQRPKEREANRQKKACRDRRTKTARQEATSLTAIFTRPHFWSKQHWTEIQ